MLTQLADGVREMGYQLEPWQLHMFETYRDELLQWNSRMNLTAITEPGEVETRHFLDSLTVLYLLGERLRNSSELSLIDIGSGAGFPGIPVKFILPQLRLTLLEATGKKAAFLQHIVNLFNLSDTEVVHGRAEEMAHQHRYREAFTVAVARAVASLSTLAEICLPFVSVGGLFIALKKGDIEAELEHSRAAFAHIGGGDVNTIDVPLRQLPDQRHLVYTVKTAPSPERFPRRTGLPFKRPL